MQTAEHAKRDPLEGLKYAFGAWPLPTLYFANPREPSVCPEYLPYGNPKTHPTCVRCGKLPEAHA